MKASRNTGKDVLRGRPAPRTTGAASDPPRTLADAKAMAGRRIGARLAIGALAAGAVFAAVPAMASAASSCTYDPVARKVVLTAAAGVTPVRIFHSGQFLRFSDGSVALGGCQGGAITATVFNTDRLDFKSTNPAGFNHLVVPADLGPGASPETDDRSELEMFLFLGTGGDQVDVIGTPKDDVMVVEGLLPTRVNLAEGGVGHDLDTDLTIATGTEPGKLVIDGAGGSDLLSGSGLEPSSRQNITGHPLVLRGGTGFDFLFGGTARDVLLGGPDDDQLGAQDGRGGDSIDGEAGVDNGAIDTGDSHRNTETVAIAVGRLALSPARLTAKAGTAARLALSWTHPKAWRELRTVTLTLRDGTAKAGTVTMKPSTGRFSAKGAVALAQTTSLAHNGRTATARLGLKLPGSLAGKTLSVDVTAVDRAGNRQVEPDAGIVVVKKNR